MITLDGCTCAKCVEYRKKTPAPPHQEPLYPTTLTHPPQLTLSSLYPHFKLPAEGRKTLKTSVKKSDGLECAVMKAFDFIQRGNTEGYTAIEFKYADCYFVIAKLKEAKS